MIILATLNVVATFIYDLVSLAADGESWTIRSVVDWALNKCKGSILVSINMCNTL